MSDVLCLLAHPDDEIFCANLLARLSDEGHSLHLACLTRGEGGRHYGDPPQATAATLGAVREQEMQASAEVLGADGLSFLNYVDRPSADDGHRAPEHDRDQLIEDIRILIEKGTPDLVLTHGSDGEYGHPAHRLLHERTAAAVDTVEPQPALYSFSAYHTARSERGPVNRWDWADLRLDVSVDEVKARALLCHRTQWTAFVGPQDTVEDYRAALVDHVVSLPAETYCCHRTGRPSISPAVFSTWVEELEPLRTHSLEAFRDGVKKHRHKVRIAAGEGLLALRQRLHRWFDG